MANTEEQTIVHTGGCFCRAVTYKVTGPPNRSAYCHCTLCHRLNAAAFILTSHFNHDKFQWTHPEPHYDALDSYSVATKPWKVRWRCKKCGATIASNNTKPGVNTWSVWGAQLDRDENNKIIGWDTIKPTAHIFYETRMLDINDDLSKWTGYENTSERIG